MPAVTAIASAPQKATRTAGFSGGAPPIQAPSAPSTARKIRAAAETTATIDSRGARKAAKVGSAAPMEKADGRGGRGLNGVGPGALSEAELVAGVGAQRILRHKLLGDLCRESRCEPAINVDLRQLAHLGPRLLIERALFSLKVGGFRIGLRADRDVFARRHRHRACRPAGEGGGEDLPAARRGGGDADHEARRRDDAVIGPQHGRPQPSDAMDEMFLGFRHRVPR